MALQNLFPQKISDRLLTDVICGATKSKKSALFLIVAEKENGLMF